MPADFNKTIEVTMTANLKALQSQLSKIPGMTKKEAAEMTKALQRELKQTQAAAKKTAQVNKRAMKQVKVSTDAAAKSAKNLRTQSREMGGAFGALEDVVSEVSPELGGFAMAIGTVGQAFRALSRSMATGNPVVLAVIVSVAALTAAYHVLTSATREAEERQKAMEEAAKKLNEKLKEQRDLASSVVGDFRDATRQLETFTGQITKFEADIAALEDKSADQLNKRLEKQDKFIQLQKEELELVQRAQKDVHSLTEEEEESLKNLILTSNIRDKNVSMFQTSSGFMHQMDELQSEISRKVRQETTFRQRIIDKSKQTVEAQKELLELQKEFAEEQEKERKREEQIARFRAKRAKIENELNSTLQSATQSQEQSEAKIFQLRTSRLSKEQQIVANAQREIDLLKEREEQIFRDFEAAEKMASKRRDSEKMREIEIEQIKAIADLETEKAEIEKTREMELAALKKKNADEEQKRTDAQQKIDDKNFEKLMKQRRAATSIGIEALTTMTQTGLQLAQENAGENKDLINFLFNANKAASLGVIAMKTAEGVAAAPAQYGPFAPVAIAAIIASGAAQAAIVASQKAPMHMGGIVAPMAPDEQSRTVLTGEAVLDRATTRRIGGESGVQKLQEGRGMGPEVIVISPFKHLDRYNRSAIRNPDSAFGRLTTTRRQRY